MTQTFRPLPLLFAVAASLLFSGSAAVAGPSSEATSDKFGWWNQTKMSTSSPAGPVETEVPLGVPDGRIAVGLGGQSGEGTQGATAIAAVGIRLDDITDGATIDSLIMTIAEDADAQSNQGTANAVIGACPITSFWSAVENGSASGNPEFDCSEANAVGERDDDGVWTFDLTDIGNVWVDPFGTITPDGVVLIPPVDSNGIYQAVFDPSTIELAIATSGGVDTDGEFGDPIPTTSTTVADNTSDFGSTRTTTPFIAPPTRPSPTLPTTTAAPTTTAPPPTLPDPGSDEIAAPTPAATPPTQVGNQVGNQAGNMPGFLIPGVLVMVLLMGAISYWLGPAGIAEAHSRQRGVSRALAQQASQGTNR